MALPINFENNEGCDTTSSNCVIWQGPDLECIDICKGDNISIIMFRIASKLCEYMDMFKLTNYDLTCLNLTSAQTPINYIELTQLLITRICALEGVEPIANDQSDCPNDCMIDLAECFQYEDSVGDTVTSLPLVDYIKLIANEICSIKTVLDNLDSRITALENNTTTTEEQISTIQNEKVDKSTLNYTFNQNTDPAQPTVFITEIVRYLETTQNTLREMLGSQTDLYKNILKSENISTDPKLFGDGNMNTINGWTNTPSTIAASLGNMWISILDIREAIIYIQENYEIAKCSSLFLNFRASVQVDGGNEYLNVRVDGSVGFNAEWKQCTKVTPITIIDGGGNSLTTSIDLLSGINNPAGLLIPLGDTPIDTSTDLTVTADTCFENNILNTTCEKEYVHIVYASAVCPAITLTLYAESVSYSFSHVSGYTYVVSVYLAGGSTPVASQVVNSPTSTVFNTITGLNSDTDYDLELTMVNSNNEENICPRETFTTLNICFTPTNVVSTAITDTTATIDWIAGSGETEWELEYGARGFTIGAGTRITGLTSPTHDITGLTASTDYDVYVRSDCGGGAFSAWTDVHEFSTTA